MFACNGPYASKANDEGLVKQNLERARQLVKESGYDGRPVTVVASTDIAHLNGAALVTRELLTSIGFNVDLKAMDWSSNLAVRAKKEPARQGAGTSCTRGGWPPTSCTRPCTSVCPGPAPVPGSAGGDPGSRS